MTDGVGFDGSVWSWIVPVNTVFIAVTAAATWLWTRGGNAAVLKRQVEDAKQNLDIANLRTERAETEYAKLLERLHEHMLTDAASFARLEAIASEASRISVSAEVRLTASLDNLGKRLDTMAERFDQFLQNQSAFISAINDHKKLIP